MSDGFNDRVSIYPKSKCLLFSYIIKHDNINRWVTINDWAIKVFDVDSMWLIVSILYLISGEKILHHVRPGHER